MKALYTLVISNALASMSLDTTFDKCFLYGNKHTKIGDVFRS